MNLAALSPEIQEYVALLLKRKVITSDSLEDKMLLNYLCSQKIDRDFLT